jgi:hypothetical protein
MKHDAMLSLRSTRRRVGALLTMELIVILPLVFAIFLTMLQLLAVTSARYRVQAASIGGADVAARAQPQNTVHQAVGLILGPHIGANYETEAEYTDFDDDGIAEANVDYVILSVRSPMGAVTTNYFGLLGGSTNELSLRSLSAKLMEADLTLPPPL